MQGEKRGRKVTQWYRTSKTDKEYTLTEHTHNTTPPSPPHTHPPAAPLPSWLSTTAHTQSSGAPLVTCETLHVTSVTRHTRIHTSRRNADKRMRISTSHIPHKNHLTHTPRTTLQRHRPHNTNSPPTLLHASRPSLISRVTVGLYGLHHLYLHAAVFNHRQHQSL